MYLVLIAVVLGLAAAGMQDAYAQQFPIEITATGMLSDSQSRELDGARSVDVFTIGSNTYAVVASFRDDGIQIVNVNDPTSPEAVGRLEERGSRELDGAYDVAVFMIGSNTYAAVVSLDDDGLQIVDVSNPARPTAAGHLADTEGSDELFLDNARSVDVFTIGSNTYAAVVSSVDDGLQIVDVSNPSNPTGVGRLADSGSILLDAPYGIDVFTIGSNTYAAVTSFGDAGLQLVDISDPVNPRSAGKVEDNSNLLLANAHEVAVFTIDNRIYAAVTSESENGLQLVDVTDPASPTPVANLGDDSSTLLRGAYGVDIFTIGDNTYAAVASNDEKGLQLVDVTDPANPTPVANLGDGGSKKLTQARGVDIFTIGGNTYAAVASFGENGLQLAEIRQIPASPDNLIPYGSLPDGTSLLLEKSRSVDTFEIGGSTYAIAVSSSESGTQIVDVTNPAAPTATGNLADNTTRLLEGARGVKVFTAGSNTYAVVTAHGDDGVEVIDVTSPASPASVGRLADDGSRLLDGATAVTTFGIGTDIYAAVTSQHDGGLQIIDITNPASPAEAGNLADNTTRLLGDTSAVDTFEIGGSTYAVVASWADDGLQIVDVTDPDNPAAAGMLADDNDLLLRGIRDMAVFETGGSTYAAVASWADDGLQIVDITDPDNPAAAGKLADDNDLLLDGASGVEIFRTDMKVYAAVASQTDDGLQIVDITDPDNPLGAGLVGDGPLYSLDAARDLAVFMIGSNTYTVVASDTEGLQTVKLTEAHNNAPVLGTIGDQTAAPDIQLVITPTVTDADSTDTHTYLISRGTLPAAAVFDTADGSIVWTPVQGDVGQTHTVTITVDDGRGGTDSETFDIVVGELVAVGSLGDDTNLLLGGAHDVDTFTIGQNTYAVVVAETDDGIQIVDVTNPASPVAVGHLSDDTNILLDGPRGVDISVIGGNTYAIVATYFESALQIVNVTDPTDPVAAGSLKDTNSLELETPQAVAVFTIGSNTYAAVASYQDNALQIVDITNPAAPMATGNLKDGGSARLDGPRDVEIFTIGSNTYAAVASSADNALQIVDVTNPADPTPAGRLSDTGSRELGGPRGVEIFTICSNTYAAVAAYKDHGLQIVDVTDPTDLMPTGKLEDSNSRNLQSPRGVAVFTTGSNIYAAVASFHDDGLQIVDVTDPTDPIAVGRLSDTGSRELGGASAVTTFTIGSSTYAAVASTSDNGLQLARLGAEAGTLPNCVPILDAIGNQTATPGIQLTITPTVTDADTTDTHTYSITRGTLPAAAVFNTSDGTLVWTPVQGDVGQTHTVTITVDDGRGGTDSETFDIAVANEGTIPPNSSPVAPNETATTVEDTSVIITPAISDPDTSDTPVISAVENPPNGTVTYDDTAIIYIPDQDYVGTDTFGYTVSDGTDTAQGTIVITVTRDNNDPVLDTIGDQNVTVDTQLTITPTVTDADTTDTHTYSISRGTLPAAAVFNTSDGTLVWTPVQGDIGQTHTVTITVDDGRGGTDSQTFDIVASPDPIVMTIGALVPQTGRSDDAGAHRTFATEQAVEDFNRYLDEKSATWRLEVDIRDTGANPAGSTEQARLLYDDGVRIISGPSASSGVSAIKANVTADGIDDMMLVSCCSTSPALAQDDNIFRLAPDDSVHGVVIADLMYRDGKEVMIPVWINDTFGHGLHDSTAAAFERLGGAVYDDVGTYQPCGDMCANNEFTDLVSNLNATVSEHAGRVGADKIFVFFIGFAETDDVVREAANYPILRTVQWVGSDANVNSSSLTGDPVIAEFLDDANFRTCIFAEDPTSQTYQSLQARFEQEFDSPPNVYAYSTYDTIWVIGLAMEEAMAPDGSIDIGSLAGNIGGIVSDYSGALGDIKLNANGDLSETSYAVHGIENRMWTKIGTYVPGTGLVREITMGALIPQTGPLGDLLGPHHTFAAEAAVSDLNVYLASIGADWRAALDIRDTEDAGVQAEIQSFDADGVRLITGPVRSSELDAIRPYADSNDMILISCCSTAPSLAIPDDNVFRLAPDDSQHGPVIADLLREDGKDVMVAVWRDDIWGIGLKNSTVAAFEEFGGITNVTVGSYDPDDPNLDAVFETLAGQLAATVSEYVEDVGADHVSVLFIGQDEMPGFVTRAADHPVLRTVQWIGSDASVLDDALVDDPKIFEFLRDANFRACVFEENSGSDQYRLLTARIHDEFDGDMPAVYTYGMYDTIWVLGLALEQAGSDAEFAAIKDAVPQAASGYVGALGDIELNEAGDLDKSEYAVWGIEDSGWIPMGTYSPHTPPAFESATLNEETGAMAITFSKSVDVSATNLTLMHVSDVNQVDTVSLRGAILEFASAYVKTLSLTLVDSQIQQVIPMDTPQLDIAAGAVSDLRGNLIGDAPDKPITVTVRVPTDDGDGDDDDDGSTGSTSSAGRGGGGGGGSRGGGSSSSSSSNVIHSSDGLGSAYIASISWDCTAGLVTISAGPPSDALWISVRTAESGVVRAVETDDQTPEGLGVFTAPMRENETYISVSAVMPYERSLSSDSQSISVDSCIGERTYDIPMSMPADTDGVAMVQPGDGIVRPPVTKETDNMAQQPDNMAQQPDNMEQQPQPQPEPVPEPVQESGGACLIATAAYGTELAPQVQALREVRDGTLLSTDSGTSFMVGFNSIYYSFSPAIADLERQNPVLREVVRIAITPMISTLSIMSLAEEGSESSVLALGASVIALNIGMYVAAPAAAVIVATRRLRI